jgi:quercetin dioxygenase-like cupin family protein
MKMESLSSSLGAAFSLAFLMLASPAAAQSTDGHQLVSPPDIKWSAGPKSLPPGAEAAVLYGDPSKEGLFALRLKFPKGYAIAPHMHPKPEVVTVISGTFSLGMGEKADQAQSKSLPAGSFFALPPNMAHFASTSEETIVQLNSNGPWTVTYVNPKDDPRQASQ